MFVCWREEAREPGGNPQGACANMTQRHKGMELGIFSLWNECQPLLHHVALVQTYIPYKCPTCSWSYQWELFKRSFLSKLSLVQVVVTNTTTLNELKSNKKIKKWLTRPERPVTFTRWQLRSAPAPLGPVTGARRRRRGRWTCRSNTEWQVRQRKMWTVNEKSEEQSIKPLSCAYR